MVGMVWRWRGVDGVAWMVGVDGWLGWLAWLGGLSGRGHA